MCVYFGVVGVILGVANNLSVMCGLMLIDFFLFIIISDGDFHYFRFSTRLRYCCSFSSTSSISDFHPHLNAYW